MSMLDEEFINRVAPQLERFRCVQTAPVPLYNFRCPSSPPFCGDSQKVKSKSRAYFHWAEGSMFFHCHNCGLHMHVSKFLEAYAPDLYGEYLAAKLASGERRAPRQASVELPLDSQLSIPSTFVNLTDLPPTHPVSIYVRHRRIPQTRWKYLYAVDETRFIGEAFPKYGDRVRGNEPRLVLPFYSETGSLVGLQARAISPDASIRYLTCKVVEGVALIYGIDRVNWARPIYVLEGPIDSLFLPNAVAVAGSDLKRVESKFPVQTTTLVFDNEPRNAEIIGKMQSCIDKGFRVCIWPETPGKDVNEMILNGWSVGRVRQTIDTQTFEGLEANLRLEQWKRRK